MSGIFCALLLAVSSAPTQPPEMTLGSYTAAARQALESRIRDVLAAYVSADSVSGTVTCRADDGFFIQGVRDALKVVTNRPCPHPGDTVEVRGAPALDGGRVVLKAETWRKTGSADLPDPVPVSARDLLAVGGESGSGRDVNALRVSLEGRAISRTANGFALQVGSLPITVVLLRLPNFLTDCAKTRPLVQVTGVAELVLDQSALFGAQRQVLGVKLHVDEPSAVVLKPDLVYLANCRDRRVAWAIAGTIALLAIGLVALVGLFIRQARRHLREDTLAVERKRMADDLHDTIEQHLVGAGMLLQLNRIKEARDVLGRAKREMRDIVWGLKNDEMMRQSPAQMLRQLAHEETAKGLYRVSTGLEGLPESLPASEMRDLSLIVREAIGNAVKHGGAKKIAISCDPLPAGGWCLRVANDGAPFTPETVPGAAEGHFGIEGMKARARRLGAELAFSRKGDWTILTINTTERNPSK